MSAVKLPDGMELALRFYATSSTAPDAHDGINIRIEIGGKTDLADLDQESIASFPLTDTLRDLDNQFGETFRAMTKSEIEVYKEDND